MTDTTVPIPENAMNTPDLKAPFPPADTLPRKRNRFLGELESKWELIRQFTPSWFTITMSTGNFATNVNGFPFAFNGQYEIGLFLWSLNVFMFVIFCSLFILRFIIFPETIKPMFRHPSQSLFMGAIPMSFSVITNGVVAFFERYSVNAILAAEIMYFVNMPMVVAVIVAIPFIMFSKHHEHGVDKMTAIWLLPVVPACVAAGTAGTVGNRLPSNAIEGDLSLALAMLLSGYALLGCGLFLSLCIIAMYLQRLIIFKLPPKELIISSFLPVGPMAMCAWAFLLLGDSCRNTFSALSTQAESLGIIWQDFLIGAHGAGVLWSLLLWGFASWWFVVALVSVGKTIQEKIPFNLGWWGSCFPTGVFTVATVALGKKLDLMGFKVIGAMLTVFQAIIWLTVFIYTVQGAFRGQLFYAPCLHSINNPKVVTNRRLSKALAMTPLQVEDDEKNPMPRDDEAVAYDDIPELPDNHADTTKET